MSSNVSRIEVLIASPSDVSEERKLVEEVFTRFNENHPAAMLYPLRWETSATPALGGHPQAIINKQLINRADLLVAIFWTKLGTPTPNAASGTAEEIQEFVKAKGPERAMLYFCTRDIPHDTDLEEVGRLRKFRQQMQSEGLYRYYKTTVDFDRVLFQDLDRKVTSLLNGSLPLPAQPEAPAVPKTASALPADRRLHKLIDFGSTIPEIAAGFQHHMDRFHAIDGCTNDKFYSLGAHVYASAADCIDRALLDSRSMTRSEIGAIDRISGRLKQLATNKPSPSADFRQYWKDGMEIAKDLSAHVRLKQNQY